MMAARRAVRVLPWPTTTPLSTVLVLLLVLAALQLHLHPADVDATVAWASTDLHNLASHPVAAMLASAFVLPGNPLPELLIVAGSLATLERAVGGRRTAAIAVVGQVIATLLTEYGTALGAHWRLVADSPEVRSDVGISYVMYAVLAAAVLTLPAATRRIALAVVSLYVLVPFALAPGMTSTGHLLSVAIGVAMMRQLAVRPASVASATWHVRRPADLAQRATVSRGSNPSPERRPR